MEETSVSDPALQFDVINTGVPGNSPFQEAIDLQRALVFEPDVVIVQFDLNDVVEPKIVRKRCGGTGIDYHRVPDRNWLDHWLREHSAFYLCWATLSEKSLTDPKDGKRVRWPEHGKSTGILLLARQRTILKDSSGRNA